jgi:hypothetical protein
MYRPILDEALARDETGDEVNYASAVTLDEAAACPPQCLHHDVRIACWA